MVLFTWSIFRVFSTHDYSKYALSYAKYRPQYPEELFLYLSSLTKRHEVAWDVATGNGQAAISLCKFYSTVIATDQRQEQLNNAKNATPYIASLLYENLPAELSEDTISSHRFWNNQILI